LKNRTSWEGIKTGGRGGLGPGKGDGIWGVSQEKISTKRIKGIGRLEGENVCGWGGNQPHPFCLIITIKKTKKPYLLKQGAKRRENCLNGLRECETPGRMEGVHSKKKRNERKKNSGVAMQDNNSEKKSQKGLKEPKQLGKKSATSDNGDLAQSIWTKKGLKRKDFLSKNARGGPGTF